MRKIGLVVALLLCASYEGRAEAKRREPPTRSEALANCRTGLPQGSPTCYQLIEVAEAAFKEGRWHPSQGPFRTGTHGIGFYADCGDRTTGTSFGRWYGVQCSYLSNIDKDPEFPVFVIERGAEKQRKEAERWTAEKARQRNAKAIASLEQTLSKALESIPGSVIELRTSVVKDRVNLYENAKELLAEAELMLQWQKRKLGDQATEYETEIRALKERNGALGRRFALQESKNFRQLTTAKLRRYSVPKLAAQARVCDLARTTADDSLAAINPDSELREPLRAASDHARDCLTKCDDLYPRAEEIYEQLVYVCKVYPEQNQALADETRRKNQIDRESGTRNLGLDRELAEQKIMLREERATAIRRLKQLGAPYSKAKCSTLE